MFFESSFFEKFIQERSRNGMLGKFSYEVVEDLHLDIANADALVRLNVVSSKNVAVGGIFISVPFHGLPFSERKTRGRGLGRWWCIGHGVKEKRWQRGRAAQRASGCSNVRKVRELFDC